MKRFGMFIKTHKLLVILLSFAIFLTGIWTPVFIVLSRQSKSLGGSSVVNTSSDATDIFAGNYSDVSNGGSSSGSSIIESVAQSSSSSSVPRKKTNKKKTDNDYSGNYNPRFKGGEGIDDGNDPIDKNAPRIICWGDSITQGMGMDDGDDYPAVLQRLIGNSYRVLNAGAGGEQSQTIAARQGAYDIYLKADLVFEAGYGSVTLDDKNGFVLEDGTLLDINEDGESFRNDLPCKKIYIAGKEYELACTGKKLQVLRESYDKKLVLKKGSKVVLDSSNLQKGSYCEIFYVGANDEGHREGDPEDVEYLINRYKAMAKRQGKNCYMVIVPQWANGYSEPLKKEFGDKAVDLKAEICKRVIENKGNSFSDKDIKEAKDGKIPTALKYENKASDTLHLNSDGYEMMAKIIYENGVKLGYWK